MSPFPDPPDLSLQDLLAPAFPGFRRDALARLTAVVEGILSSGRVTHSAIARTLHGSASPASKIERVARTFHHTPLYMTLVTSLILGRLGDDPLTLVLDRTNWSMGQHPQNLLVLGAWLVEVI